MLVLSGGIDMWERHFFLFYSLKALSPSFLFIQTALAAAVAAAAAPTVAALGSYWADPLSVHVWLKMRIAFLEERRCGLFPRLCSVHACGWLASGAAIVAATVSAAVIRAAFARRPLLLLLSFS